MAYYPPFTQQVHYCGLYYVVPNQYQIQKQYLPQVDLQAHSTVLSTTSRTTLTQTFVNPSSTKAIHEVRYTFPLYDGVSVVGFQCHVGDRTIVGEVKEKEKARAVFKEAVAQGQTAGLFEQLPDAADVFTTTVGNIPPGARVVVRITYLGELKHDMEVDGIRFTIPNIICPRYGQLPNAFHQSADTVDAKGTGISITVDAEMADGSFIQKIQSPSHPISISMGTTSFAPNAEPKMTKASATLTLGTAELETDFVLQIIAKDTGMPKAVLETHPTLPSHRALMATLVPKFALPAEKPEIVFVIDQSGSMSGSRNKLAVQALKVFLKSLPVGVKFNICAFGSRFDYLWPSSVTYSQETLDTATKYADNLDANYGGTNILEPLQATIEKRYKDMPLEIMLLTDGEVWNQDALFQYLNQQISATQTPIRLFSLGIGNGVSHSLIEGVAKAGNGFSQVVGEGEQMDSKVVRMLKGALSPHVNDYTLEVKYSTNPEAVAGEEDDYEIVEKVADSLTVKLDLGDEKQKQKESQTKKPISLFDQSINPDQEAPPAHDETGEARYAHLPKVPVPKIIQAPQNIPSLFAFIRTNVYLLLGPNAPQSTPKSVVLRGTSNHGPLELEIPVQILETPGETIHQLAAKKAISELEQGRGWLPEAKDDSGSLIKSKFEGRFSDMVEREAVRLGVQFQVGGKWCSFVAVEKNKTGDEKMNEDYEYLDDEIPEEIPRQSSTTTAPLAKRVTRKMKLCTPSLERGERLDSLQDTSNQLSVQSKLFYSKAKKQNASLLGSVGSFLGASRSKSQASAAPQAFGFGAAPSAPSASATYMPSPGPPKTGGTSLQDYQSGLMVLEQQSKKRLLMARQEQDTPVLFGAAAPPPPPAPAAFSTGGGGFGSAYGAGPGGPSPFMTNSQTNPASRRKSLKGPAPPPPPPQQQSSASLFGGFGSSTTSHGEVFRRNAPTTGSAFPQPSVKIGGDLLQFLVALQTFEGSWEWTSALFITVGVEEGRVESERGALGVEKKIFATALVIAVFEEKLGGSKGSWELVVEKAKSWLEFNAGGKSEDVDTVIDKARVLVK